MAFKRINMTKEIMVDELGRLMDQAFTIIQPRKDPKTGRLVFTTAGEERGAPPVERDLAVEVFRHHADPAPPAVMVIEPKHVGFKDKDPGNCRFENLVYTGPAFDESGAMNAGEETAEAAESAEERGGEGVTDSGEQDAQGSGAPEGDSEKKDAPTDEAKAPAKKRASRAKK